MHVKLRPGNSKDAQRCGVICYEAFRTIAEQHNFPPDFTSSADVVALVERMLTHSDVYSVIAELDGKIVGSNFLDERSMVTGIGPITVDPAMQNYGIGNRLMQHVLGRVRQRSFPGVRLVQAAYHNRSLSLYTRLGFVAREPLSTIQGKPLSAQIQGYTVRPATERDLEACNQVCMKVHGHDRKKELLEAIQQGTATLVEHGGHITGYATTISFFGHAVGETNDALKALIGAAPVFEGPGFLLPIRNTELFRWCLNHGLRVVQPMTLMSIGLYNEPSGAFLPSVLY